MTPSNSLIWLYTITIGGRCAFTVGRSCDRPDRAILPSSIIQARGHRFSEELSVGSGVTTDNRLRMQASTTLRSDD